MIEKPKHPVLYCLILMIGYGAFTANAWSQSEQPAPPTETPRSGQASFLLVVVGAPGEPEYQAAFADAAADWQTLSAANDIPSQVIGLTADKEHTDFQILQDTLESQANSERRLWLVLIGHGTFDGRKARFNLTGPDISADQLADMLRSTKQPLVLINCASCSGPFINALSAPNRIVVTATKSGAQYNATRFGQNLGQAIGSRSNDLDKDGQISLLEAFVAASAATRDFYETEKRLATESALIDDNGDQQGTPANWFSGVRATKLAAKAKSPDGIAANQVVLIPSPSESKLNPEQRESRNRLEAELDSIRRRRSEFSEAEYLLQIEPLLIQLARIYEDRTEKSR